MVPMSEGTISTFQTLKGQNWVAFIEQDVLYISGNDVGWEKFVVLEGEAHDLDIGHPEAAWIHACWLEFQGRNPPPQG